MNASRPVVGTNRCLVLASGSPRRRELLEELVGAFSVRVSGVPEPIDLAVSPVGNVLAIARAKAGAVATEAGECIVLAADTDVVLDGEILGKPVDERDAIAMLKRLRGREHDVLTAVVVADPVEQHQWEAVVCSRVHLRELSDAEIDTYVATGEPLDKAGGYAIQGHAGSMVQSIDGCYTSVVGLPLCATRRLLAQAGLTIDSGARCADPFGNDCPHNDIANA